MNTATPVQDEIRQVLSDNKPRTAREVAITILNARGEQLEYGAIVSLRQHVSRMFRAGVLERRGAKSEGGSRGTTEWCYILAEGKA